MVEKNASVLEEVLKEVHSDHREFALKCKKFIDEGKVEGLSVESKDQLELFLSNDYFKRFTNARDGDIEKAYTMWENWVKWRLSFKPEQITSDSIIDELKLGKVFLFGHDKGKRPCIIVKTGLHFPSKTCFENTYRLGIYWLEKILKLADLTELKEIVVIIDRTDTGLKNIDYGAISNGGMISKLQDYYCERLHKIFILHANFLFRQVFNLAKVFMSDKTKSKMQILESVNLLKEYFDEDQLLVEHGGKSSYAYIPPS